MPVILKLAALFLLLPLAYALATAWMPDDAVQEIVEVIIAIGVIAAVMGIPVFIVATVLQALNPPRRRG